MNISANNPDSHSAVSINPQSEDKTVEEQLRFQTALLRAQSEASLDGILVVSANREWLTFNHRFIKMWRIPETVVQRRSSKIALQAVLNQLSDPDQFLTKVEYLYENPAEESRDEIALKDGRVFDRYSAPIYGTEDEYYGRVWYYRDVTERKQAERALRESEARFRSLVEQAADAIFVHDFEGQILNVNRAACESLGYNREELLSMAVYQIDAAYPTLEACQTVWKAILPGHPVTASGRHKRKDGSEFPVDVRVGLLEEGPFPQLVALVRDVTERKQAENALRESEKRYRMLMEQSPLSIQVFDSNGVLVEANKAWEEMWGAKAEQVVGKYNPLTDPQIENMGLLPLIKQVFSGKTVAFEDTVFDPSTSGLPGRKRWIRVHAYPLKDEMGLIQNVVVFNQDITERVQAEQALQEQNSFRSAIIQRAAEGLCVCHAIEDFPYVHFTEWNERMEAITGYTIAEINEKGWYQSLYPDREVRERAIERMDRMRYGDDLQAEEWKITRADGQKRTVAISTRLLETSDGTAHVLALMEDVTERQRAEEALRESEERFRKIFEEGPIGMAILSPEDRFIRANTALCDMVGYSEDELIGSTFLDITHPEDIEIGRYQAQQLLSGEIPNVQTEKRYVTKEGQTLWINLTASFIHDDGGIPRYKLTMIEDITERKQAEVALQQSEAYFRSLIENISDIITVLDVDGTIRFESPSIERVLGYTSDELVGQNAFSLVHPFDRSTVQQTLAERLSIPGPGPSMEIRFKHKDGSWRDLEVIGNNLLDDPVVNSIVVTSRDITERKQLEEQLRQAQRMEAVGQLTAGIAHDFNNLLTTINGFAELIQLELSPDDPLGEMIDKVLRAGQRAADLVRQLLAFSRKQIIQPQVLDLNSVVAEMSKMLQRTIGEHIDFKTVLSSKLHPVKMDPAQVEQVILNLAVNARDAMPEGGTLTIETANVVLDESYVANHFEVQPGKYVLLAVSDTGAGMSREVQARVFEPFYTTKEVGQGTGLGLATVYGIIKQSGGNIQVYSETGGGTTFKIYLPRAEATKLDLTRTTALAEMPAGTETILLVEDAEGVRELVSDILQAQGYTVFEARDGQEALQLAADYDHPIHLLLTDVVMPGISGQVLAQKLSQGQPALKTLYMSGYTDNAIAHHGVLDPGIAFLQKPFSPTALVRQVREVLDSV